MSRIFPLDFGSCPRKMLAIKLADHADDDGCGIWPSVSRLARDCNISVRTVQRLLKDFVTEGFLVIVTEGGKGKGSTTRYDFDLEKLPDSDGNSPNSKGDRVSPLDNSLGDTDDTKGDTDDILGCQGVTQTIIEPSSNHHSLSGGASESAADAPERERAAPEFSEKKASEDKRFWQAFDDYPRFQTSSKKPMYVAWAKLTEERRDQITKARVMAYLDLCRRDGVRHPPAIGVILSEDDLLFNPKIEALLAKDDVPSDDGSQPLNKFGKAWGVVRLLWLRAGAKPIGDVPDYRRHRDMFPKVHAMNGSAITRLSPQNAVKAETLDACQRVEQGSAEWQAWADYHAAMDWPMVEVGDWDKPVWFPARVPSELAGYQEVAV